MREALKELSAEQIGFICKECSISKDELFAMDDDTLYDEVYDVMCDIEIDEIADGEDTERCEMASSIVTELGNTLAEKED